MSYNSEKNKTIAKNTFLLYFRMILLMCINLYASRVVLDALGISDYGIYNVVGGVIAMFSFLSSSFSTSISRYITFALGEGDKNNLKKVFSTSVNVQVLISLIIVVLAEIAGIWFLENKINLPDGRLEAAHWVFQCSLLAFVVNLISVPYNASIIAHEKMNAFAYISILESLLKLLIIFLLYKSPFDKLKTYSVLVLIVSIIIRYVYGHYSKKHFEECSYHFVYDKEQMKRMFSFAGWNMVGNGAWILNTQGINILINLFFGVTLNAARGIATQISGVVKQFTSNFGTAFSPQLTKSYAEGDLRRFHKLIITSSKINAFLFLMLMIPICLEVESILKLWLVEVPEYTAAFVRYTLISSFFVCIGDPLYSANNSTGNIKKYQIVTTFLTLLNFPLSYIFFKLDYGVESTYIIYIIVCVIVDIVAPFVTQSNIGLSAGVYIKNVLVCVMCVSLLSFLPSWLFVIIQEESIFRLIGTSIISVLFTSICVYFVGLNHDEKALVKTVAQRFKNKQKNNN